MSFTRLAGLTVMVAGAGLIIHGATQTAPKLIEAKPLQVGARPGNVGQAMDIEKVAKDRGNELATFAAGCFWGVEWEFRNIPGVAQTAVGYTGGRTENPTYKEVCSDQTGHAEAVLVEFDPKKVTYERLVRAFFELHDPTTKDRQGPDIGSQYRSAIHFHSPEQEKVARAVVALLQEKFNRPIVTEIKPASKFYLAEDYHQQYYEKKGIAPACRVKK